LDLGKRKICGENSIKEFKKKKKIKREKKKKNIKILK
jgi:hypothetical protein